LNVYLKLLKAKIEKEVKLLVIFTIFVLIFQVGLFFLIRKKKKLDKENNMIAKYNIKSSGDAWKLINDLTIPEEDRLKIEEFYKKEETP